MLPYTEIQQKKYRWYLLGFVLLCEGAFLIYLFNQFRGLVQDPLLFLAPIVGFVFFNGFYYLAFFQQLTIQIDELGVHFQAPLSWTRWQHIPWTAIDRLHVRKVALFGEYPKGPLGMRQGPNGFAYVPMMGLFGLQIEKTTGDKYLLGTQQPDLLRAYLLNRQAASPVSAA